MYKLLLAAFLAITLAGCSTVSGLFSSASVKTEANEMVAYAPPYTAAKMNAACGVTSPDLVTKLACLKLKAVAAQCAGDLSQATALVNSALALIPQGGAEAVVLNNAFVAPEALTLVCKDGGFPTATTVSVP